MCLCTKISLPGLKMAIRQTFKALTAGGTSAVAHLGREHFEPWWSQFINTTDLCFPDFFFKGKILSPPQTKWLWGAHWPCLPFYACLQHSSGKLRPDALSGRCFTVFLIQEQSGKTAHSDFAFDYGRLWNGSR